MNGKRAAGYAAAELVKDGMIVGIGTGSTVFFFIEKLIEKVGDGLIIKCVSSSNRSTEQAEEGGIAIVDAGEITEIDLTVDGADEIDPEGRMIKGGGGALLREKILASSSKEMVVIVDESKCVEKLGKFKLPVEIVPFAVESTIHRINKHGYLGTIREEKTDNGNYIYDIHFESLRNDPEADHWKLIDIPGVVETGFFFNLAKKLIVGKTDGNIEEKTF